MAEQDSQKAVEQQANGAAQDAAPATPAPEGGSAGAAGDSGEAVSGQAADTAGGADAADAFDWTTLPDWVPEPLPEAWAMVLEHPILGALAVVLVSLVLAKIVDLFVTQVLKRLTARTRSDVDDQIVAKMHRPVFLTVFFTGLIVATHVMRLPSGVEWATIGLIKTLLIVVWFQALFGSCRLLLDALGRQGERFKLIEERTIPLLDMVGKLLILGGASYAILLAWNIDPTAWLASAGVIGLAVGFAAKDTLANLFAGFFILTDAPYKIGDWIQLDTGERGKVVNVGIRSTRLQTRDDIEVTLPNAVIANAKIVNESGGHWIKERIRLKFGVAYGSDLDHVCKVVNQVAIDHPEIIDSPTPRVRMRAFGDSSVDFELLCWIDEPVNRGLRTHELYMEIYRAFKRENIEIPYPKRDVYLHQMGGEG